MPNVDVDIDIDDDVHQGGHPHAQSFYAQRPAPPPQQPPQLPPYRPSVGYAPRPSAVKQERQVPPRAAPSASMPPRRADSGSYHARGTRGGNGNGTVADVDEDGEHDEHDAYRRSLLQASSFNVEQMIQMRESSGTFRDSLLVAPNRQTELGSALMRMDDGYARAAGPPPPQQPQQQLRGRGDRSASGSLSRSSSLILPAGSAEGLTPLLQAARSGDLVLLNALVIQPGTDILRRDPMYGQTALHFAIRGGHLGVVQALLMPQLAGSIVNVADSRRNTALHLAAAKSRRMTKLLLDAGADVNFLNMRNQTPLGVHLLTVTRDDPTLTEILLQHRANANAPVDQSTALHVALDKGLLQIAARLVRYGARLDLKDEAGKMVFDKLDPAALKLLLRQVAAPPVWVRDAERAACMECAKKFGVGARRHHCRLCGRLLCSACASCHVKNSQLPFKLRKRGKKKAEPAGKKARVCATCHDVTTDNVAAAAHGRTASRSSRRRH
ncbi:hypothetical protein PybrP1_002821 [[Pythium] brassicae (nom. inval.)]|nr:hypothetical protein PybrP1_002821 [[Pythium] brassicae (nom. inval.)]